MKKNIVLILSFILLIICIITLQVKIPRNNNNLKGEKIGDKLYYYDLELNNENMFSWYFKDDIIYYLTYPIESEEGNYTYWKLNIKTGEKTKVATIEEEQADCQLKTDYIECDNYNENKVVIYNLNYEKIYSETITKDIHNYLEYFPYKDTFLKVLDDTIYINQQGKDIETRKLKKLGEYPSFIDFYSTDDNVYLLFLNGDTGEYVLYDYNNDTYQEYTHGMSEKYGNGFIIVTKNEYTVLDLKNNKTLKYPNVLEKDDMYSLIMKVDNETLFIYDNNDLLKVENIAKETIKELNEDTFNNKLIIRMQIENEYLAIESDNDGKNVLYILDLTKVGDITEKTSDYLTRKNNEIETKKQELENKYGITIHIKEEGVSKFPDFTAEPLLDNNIIVKALNEISEVLQKYNPEFFKEFTYQNHTGFQIYLTSTLAPVNYDTQIANPAAYSLFYQDKFTIAIDGEQSDLKNIFCHELFHNLENRLELNEVASFLDWDTYNPIDFNYNYSYTAPTSSKYTLYNSEEKKENIYFIREYDYTFPSEDRADIFGAICSCNEDSEVNNYPNLYKKSIYLRDEILKNYPMLQDTTLFRSLH